MAKNTKQRFVQARLKETSKEATPEQRAKFRQRFEVLASTQEGRTRIAQVVAPKADAKTRAALKKSLVPQTKTDTKVTPVVTNRGYSPGITNNVNMPSNNAASSAVVKRVDPGYTPSYPGATKSSGNQTNPLIKKFDKFAGDLTGANQIMKAIQSDGSIVSRVGTATKGLATGILSTAGGGPIKSGIRNIPVPGPLQQPVINIIRGGIKAKKFLQSGGPVVQQLPPGVVGAVKTTTKTLGKTMGKTSGRLKNTR